MFVQSDLDLLLRDKIPRLSYEYPVESLAFEGLKCFFLD